MREVVTVHVGGFGLNMVPHIHAMSTDDEANPQFYEETMRGFRPRAVLIDGDQRALDEFTLHSPMRKAIDPSQIICGHKDAPFDFSEGYVSYQIEDPLRRLLERTDNCEGFVLFNSWQGVSGTGMAARFRESA